MRQRVFVTGMGTVSPLGLDTTATWSAAISGRSGVGYITHFSTEGFDTRIAAEVKEFEPANFMDRKEARRLDRFTQFAVVAAEEALNQARLDPRDVDPCAAAVILGTGIGGTTSLTAQLELLRSRGPTRVSPLLGVYMLSDIGAAVLSMRFGFTGTAYAVVTACSSGADALGQALRLIRHGDADVVLAGGAEAAICPLSVSSFGVMGALSRRNDDPPAASRPFDRLRDGFVIGEGSALLVLESESHARARKATPLVELCGFGSTSDAYHISAPDPDGHGARKAMEKALADAELDADTVDYINAHGTSTPLNDKTETVAIKRALGAHAADVAVSSTKSMTGHLLGAAGALEALFCVQAIVTGVIPPTINLTDPDPECDLDYTPGSAQRRQVSVAMSNSFGFGGHNAVLCFRAVDAEPHSQGVTTEG